jgi:hypothetical protein
MPESKKLLDSFGINEYGLIDIKGKISNVKISRILNCDKVGGCPYCFPHGYETTNSTLANRTRNWKNKRKTRWKSN